jgi:hypothetical protein
VAGVDALPLGPLWIDLRLGLELLFPDDGGAVAGPPMEEDGSAFSPSVDAELLG